MASRAGHLVGFVTARRRGLQRWWCRGNIGSRVQQCHRGSWPEPPQSTLSGLSEHSSKPTISLDRCAPHFRRECAPSFLRCPVTTFADHQISHAILCEGAYRVAVGYKGFPRLADHLRLSGDGCRLRRKAEPQPAPPSPGPVTPSGRRPFRRRRTCGRRWRRVPLGPRRASSSRR